MALARIDLRPLVLKAITAHFVANPTHGFVTGIGGRFSFERAKQGTPLPYCVFFFVDDLDASTWTERAADVLVQFSVWATTASAALNLCSLAYDLFEGQTLSATGLVPFKLFRKRNAQVPLLDESDETTQLFQSGICLSQMVQAI